MAFTFGMRYRVRITNVCKMQRCFRVITFTRNFTVFLNPGQWRDIDEMMYVSVFEGNRFHDLTSSRNTALSAAFIKELPG